MSKKETGMVKVNPVEYVAKNGFPEIGVFNTEKELQKFYKKLDIVTLEEWASLEGAEFKPCPTSEPIHRMRVCMAILYKHFPKQASAKKESKYAQYSLEDLVTLATEHDVPVEVTDDDRIMRMRLIMALRASQVIG